MGGEIVEVEGGHIVRSRGRKDRHSKVCTAKGPRDRRVRLSAHTAIEFYDVQDRLGYDRPSKALDWLIDKAKPAIDQLAQLPPWKPTLSNPNPQQQQQQQQQQNDDVVVAGNENPNHNNQHQHGFIFQDDEEKQKQKENIDNHSGPGSGLGLGPGHGGFLPFDTEMVDTIRSYFPATTSSSAIQFQSYPQDLRLSLQSYEDTSLNQNQHVQQHVLFTGTLDGMVPWNSGGGNLDTGNNDSAAGGGFVFHAPSPAAVTLPMVMYGQNQYLSQRGPLQSSNTPSVRAWMDAPSFVAADYRQCLSMAAPSSSHSALGPGFAPGGFSGFRVPARIWGDDEEEHGDMPSSASSDSRR